MNYNLHEKNIPREYINKTLIGDYYSIWDIVQLIGHSAVDFELMPKEIREKVESELHRRGKLWRNTMSRSLHSEIVNPLGEK